MRKILSILLLSLIITSCSLFKDEIIELDAKNNILTEEEREKIEKEQFDRLLAEEDKEDKEFIEKQLKLESDKLNILYEQERSNMTVEEIKEEKRLLKLDKMITTPIIK